MASSVLERMRSLLELSEQLENQVGKVLEVPPLGQKNKTYQQHRVAKLVEQINHSNMELLALYEDRDERLKEEIVLLSGANAFPSFYDSLKNSQEYHQQRAIVDRIEEPEEDAMEVTVAFSGDEIFGKYMDLNALYVDYCNLPHMVTEDLDYSSYLSKFNSFFYIPEVCKATRAYAAYIKALWDYVHTFFLKVQPLVELSLHLEKWHSQFEDKWAKGLIAGWRTSTVRKNDPQPLRLGMFNSSEELEALGNERLKEALEALDLKCGGTLTEKAERLWLVRGKRSEDIPVKLKAKSKGASDESRDTRKETAWREVCIENVCDLLVETVVATRRHAEKQHLRTVEEKEAEIEEEEHGLLPDISMKEDDEGDNEGPLYNPLNLPLGWDGKPIPFWLYKLHGLGTEYKCEICGNQSYWGRRAFDKHFQEWRHAQGMRCLGVPNTKHFHDITLIADALALYNKIKSSLKLEMFQGDMDEEFEDTDGNVLNRRTYEDLARQGLL